MNWATRSALTSVTLLATFMPNTAVACIQYTPPNMCEAAAHDETFWIGEYSGRTTSFSMKIEGGPFNAEFKDRGSLTLFSMSGALGFSGGGAFQGEANLVPSPGNYIDPLDPTWEWIEEIETLDMLNFFGQYSSCGYQFWPRWEGTYRPSPSLEMKIALIGLYPSYMIGRISYSGRQEGKRVEIDSRFDISRNSIDVSGWLVSELDDDTPECQNDCVDSGSLINGYVWSNCPAN